MDQISSSASVGQGPQKSPDSKLILSYPTLFPHLDANYLRTSIILSIGGGIIFLIFLSVRIIRLLTLRKPIPSVHDPEGNNVLYMSTTKKYLGWPGVIITKIKSKSFNLAGVPSLGTILILMIWIGIMVAATLLFILPALDLEGIAYRLP